MSLNFKSINKSSLHYKLISKKIKKYRQYDPYRTITLAQYITWCIWSVVSKIVIVGANIFNAWIFGRFVSFAKPDLLTDSPVLEFITGATIVAMAYGFFYGIAWFVKFIENAKTVIVFDNDEESSEQTKNEDNAPENIYSSKD